MKKAFLFTIALLALSVGTAIPADWSAVISQYNAAGASTTYGLIGNDTAAPIDGSLDNTHGGANIYCFMFTTTTAGSVDQVNVQIGSWSASDDLYVGIYSHDATNSRPLNQLGYGWAATWTTNVVTTHSLDAAETIAASTNYWLCATATVGETYFGASATTGATCLRAGAVAGTNNGLTPDGYSSYLSCANTDLPVFYADNSGAP